MTQKTPPKEIVHKKRSLHASVSPFLLAEMDKLVKVEKFTSRSDFTSVACAYLLEKMSNEEGVKVEN
jgi:metal-responsive CopG/Arc/MetJ family transcriptional regulator